MGQFILFVNEQWILCSILLLLLFALLMYERFKSGKSISAQEVAALMNHENAVVLDIRDSGEFKQGHIVDAINIPFNRLNSDMKLLDEHKEKPVILVCKLGQHSGSAGKQLKAAGFNVLRLQGGITEWQNNNMPLVKQG